MNPILRLIQIDLIVDKPTRLTIWFNMLCDKMETFEEGSETIYYMDKEVVLLKDDKHIWCHYGHFWGVISDIIDEDYRTEGNYASYSDIQDVIMFLFESKYNKDYGLPMTFTSGTDYDYYQRLLNQKLLNVQYYEQH